jgi:hypothetical protein
MKKHKCYTCLFGEHESPFCLLRVQAVKKANGDDDSYVEPCEDTSAYVEMPKGGRRKNLLQTDSNGNIKVQY